MFNNIDMFLNIFLLFHICMCEMALTTMRNFTFLCFSFSHKNVAWKTINNYFYYPISFFIPLITPSHHFDLYLSAHIRIHNFYNFLSSAGLEPPTPGLQGKRLNRLTTETIGKAFS